MLAEKPSVGRDLAAFLGARTRRDGYLEGNGYQVTWAFGHLAELKAPDEYDPQLKRWTLATLPFVPEVFELRVVKDPRSQQQFRIIQRLFAAADEIICATDAGREGELIFRYVLELAGCPEKPIRRLWLSSLTEAAIAAAFDDLRAGSEYRNLFEAARCRSESDWIVGLNGTRNFTVRYGQNGVLWSVGRVQTPVLALIVARDDEIQTFVPQTYWELRTRYRDTLFKHCGVRPAKQSAIRFDALDAAREVLGRVRNRPLEITSITGKQERIQPPLLFDLTTLQREMNRRAGFAAARTLELAQKLYEHKMLTYPRTDSRHLPAAMHGEVGTLLQRLRSERAEAIDRLDLEALPDSRRIFDDTKITDHHAIIPTGNTAAMSGDERRVYDAVVTRLIAAFYPPCIKQVTTVDANSAGVPFRARGVLISDPGWTVLEQSSSPARSKGDDAQVLPTFRQGEQGPHEPELHQAETKPPRPYNDNTLLASMETAGRLVDDEELRSALRDKGLGTPATRAAIIETLLRRRYIRRDKKALLATDLGRYLIALIGDAQLKSAQLTGEWEAKLKRIERGELEPAAFRAEVERYTQHLIDSGGQPPIDASSLGTCPRCAAPIVEGSKGYGCSAWKAGCNFVLWKEFRGVHIGPNQARELLQRRMLVRPVVMEDGESAVLYRTAQGGILALHPPTRDRQQAEAKRGRPAKKKRAAPARTQRSPEPTLCPLCRARLVETDKAYCCAAWRDGCKFAIWKRIAGKKISKAMAKKLIQKGKTQVLKGFVSKSGKKFDARLILQDGQVRFEF